MTQPTLEDARALTGWRPRLGVISVYLGFDPADRGGAWRTELRNGLDAVLEAHKDGDHDTKVALRATVKRLLERFEDGDLRPPPRGEAGFVEVAEKEGEERWWGTGAAPAATACVEYGPEPSVAPLIELVCRGELRGVAVVSKERVKLLSWCEGALADWELTITSRDWRERKSQSTNNPARAQGVSASGHDQFGERLDHNRQRFLTECGGLAARAVEEHGLGELIVFGPSGDVESFSAGFGSGNGHGRRLSHGGDADLISAPRAQLNEVVSAAAEQLGMERDLAQVERALEEARGGSRGAAGLQETVEALGEGRVDRLVFDAGIGEAAEPLVRGALAGSASITMVRDEAAAPLGIRSGTETARGEEAEHE
jgi:Bacterial archaeo-eukaryotic release factor family 10